MSLDYVWTARGFQVRSGDDYVEIGGRRTFMNLADAHDHLRRHGLRLGRKLNGGSWEVLDINARLGEPPPKVKRTGPHWSRRRGWA